jgi:hypothetical protein
VLFRSEQDLARRQGQRVIFTRDLIHTLRRRELDEAASKLSAHTGLAHRPCAEGEHVSGICRQRVTLASERFVMIDDGLGFQLVTWRPALEQRLGQQVSGTLTPGGGIDWSFQRKRGLGNRHRLMKPLAHFGPFVGLSRHGRNPTPPGRSSLPWGICPTTSRCAASWLVKPAGDPDDALGVTAIQKRTPSAASFNIWALRFSAARSPASKAGMSVFTTPAAPSTRGKESATSRTPWHSGVARKQVQPALPRPLVGPSRKHDDSCAVEIGQLSGANAKGIRKRRSVQNVARLCDRQIGITVDERAPNRRGASSWHKLRWRRPVRPRQCRSSRGSSYRERIFSSTLAKTVDMARSDGSALLLGPYPAPVRCPRRNEGQCCAAEAFHQLHHRLLK